MIYTANELHPKLEHLTLVGQDDDGTLEFCGTDAQWRMTDAEPHWACGKYNCTCDADRQDYEANLHH